MQRAFTLIEILLTVALLGLLSAALVSGAARLVGDHPRSPEEMFWAAVGAARRLALKTEAETRLAYDAKEKTFVVDGRGSRESFAIQDESKLTVDLLQAQSAGGSILVGGQLIDTHTLAAVDFYPDGTCQPFRVQFRSAGPARVLTIDPWTCSSVLSAKP